MTYRLAFILRKKTSTSLAMLTSILEGKGEKTFVIRGQDKWYHKRYGSTVTWTFDAATGIVTSLVEGGDAARACGSLVEWMLRNVEDYLDDGPVVTVSG